MATLAEIRAKLKEQEERNSGTSRNTNYDNTVYPFWNAPEGKECVIRFLPDGDENNTFFWVEQQMINLTFSGIKGQNDSREITVKIPCVEMYGKNESCPILAEVRPWWNDPTLKPLASKYWKKYSYKFQGFVVEDGLGEENPPENPIRKFTVGPQIFKLIKDAIFDPELESLPTDFVDGLDFRISKTGKGQYSDYSTSKWSRRTRPLTEQELEALEKFELYNLSSLLPPKPTSEDLKAFKEMFEASVDGEPFDEDRWGKYYRSRSSSGSNDQSEPTVQKPAVAKPQPVIEPVNDVEIEEDDDSAPWSAPVTNSEPVSAPSNTKAADILAMIRSRQTQA